MKIEDILEKLRAGNVKSAKTDIFDALETGKLKAKDKLVLSQLLNDFGLLNMGIELLGKTRPANEYELLDSYELMAQFYLGVLYNNIGSKYYSDYIIDLCLREISKRKINPLIYMPRYYNQLAGKYYKNDEKEKFLDTINCGLKNPQIAPYQQANLQLDFVYFCLRENNLADAQKMLKQLDQAFISQFRPILIRQKEAQAQFTLKLGQRQKAKILYHELLCENLHPYQFSNVHFHLGILYSQQKDISKAKKHLRTSWEIFRDEKTPRTWLRGFSYYCQLSKSKSDNKMSYKEKLTYYCNRLYSTHKEKVMPKIPATHCIKVYKRKVTIENYATIIKEGILKKSLLDLKTGLLHRQGEIKHLGESKTLALQLLCSSALWGIHRIYLQDYIYREDFESIGAGHNKLDKLIHDLRQDGFEIERRHNRYYWLPPENLLVCQPDHSSVEAPVVQMAVRFDFFERQQLQSAYSVSKATAMRWINHGLESNRLKVYNKNRTNVLYSMS